MDGINDQLLTLAEAACCLESNKRIISCIQVKVKPKRKRASPWQLYALQRYYQANPFPENNFRNSLAVRLNMSPRAIQNWFQNRRQVERKK